MTDELQYESFQLYGVESAEHGLDTLLEWSLAELDFVERVVVDTQRQAVCAVVSPGLARRKELKFAIERLGFRVGQPLQECRHD